MIYKFRSKASGDVLMLQAHGDTLLRVLGREPAARGIIEVAAMASALSAIEAAVARDEQPGEAGAPGGQDAAEASDAPAAAVGLRQRLWPMVDMLRRCQAEGEPIVWGV
jgi:hypothetical protein